MPCYGGRQWMAACADKLLDGPAVADCNAALEAYKFRSWPHSV